MAHYPGNSFANFVNVRAGQKALEISEFAARQVPMLKVAERWIERRALADGVTWLYEPHVDAFLRCNIWHVRGRDRDLIVDTGLGCFPAARSNHRPY